MESRFCKCGKPRRAKGQRYCRDCHSESMRRTRPKHSELSPEQRRRSNTRAYTNVYIRRGNLIPAPCAKCGAKKVQPHHHDYSKPLVVTWLCRPCHLAEHGKRPQTPLYSSRQA